ncbi:MAG: hypothetical protein Q9226_009385, partial [Calogaya cf. arnoldii]
HAEAKSEELQIAAECPTHKLIGNLSTLADKVEGWYQDLGDLHKALTYCHLRRTWEIDGSDLNLASRVTVTWQHEQWAKKQIQRLGKKAYCGEDPAEVFQGSVLQSELQ